jgi:putative transposase
LYPVVHFHVVRKEHSSGPDRTHRLAKYSAVDLRCALEEQWRDVLDGQVNRKRVVQLMRLMGIAAIYQRPNTSRPEPGHKIYPYLLRGMEISRVNQVCWHHLHMARGFVYLVAIMDWYSRFVLSWELSNTLDVGFCLVALERALEVGKPEIFNSDQGTQFTAAAFTWRLESCGISISMDGRGRARDNIFTERLWRTIKYEEVYLHEYANTK